MQISSMRVFYATIVGLVVGLLFHLLQNITGIGNKTSYGYSSKIKYWSRD
jgi:type III secretory pathway component EscS